jgi:hypothetical protein
MEDGEQLTVMENNKATDTAAKVEGCLPIIPPDQPRDL